MYVYVGMCVWVYVCVLTFVSLTCSWTWGHQTVCCSSPWRSWGRCRRGPQWSGSSAPWRCDTGSGTWWALSHWSSPLLGSSHTHCSNSTTHARPPIQQQIYGVTISYINSYNCTYCNTSWHISLHSFCTICQYTRIPKSSASILWQQPFDTVYHIPSNWHPPPRLCNRSKEVLNVLKNIYLALRKPTIAGEHWTGFVYNEISWLKMRLKVWDSSVQTCLRG